ncbi:glucosaminidase domain-containing protein [Sulfurospirillum arcachonense]|uniref:glucosaminidase domain-containing protein n=1 Tax=Sulfurospirillum arcachonense TaxID=57666 RepID=UPI00046A3002|nr:glucosaminidase domain-containing protein [Sulfurospirillum arcachonense]
MKQLFKLVISVSLFTTATFSIGFPESYYEIKNIKEQKREFINILKPLVDKSNQKVKQERVFLKNFFAQAMQNAFRSLNPKDLKELLRLSKKYRVKKLFDKNKYLQRVDIVPVPLALAQGAIESGWGKSRFVRLANNIFGHWTWGEVGIIPEGREEGKSHKIRIFKTLQDSVNAYILNLNRHYAYAEFRKVRRLKSLEGKSITGNEAAQTMINYSELREKYVQMLQKMMKDHRLLYYEAGKL